MRHALKPMKRRLSTLARHERLRKAIEGIKERGIASLLAPEIAERERAARKALPAGRWKDKDAAKSWIEFAFILFMARRISLQEYVFWVASSAEDVRDDCILNRKYPELEDLSEKIQAVKEAHGLQADEYWPSGSGPAEYHALNASWESAVDERYVDILLELEHNAAAQLCREDRIEFERLRERGRRSFFHKNDFIAMLSDTIIRYENEAHAAASARAYTAAVTLIGAALEGLLLLRCLRSNRKAVLVAEALPRSKRPRLGSTPPEWTFDTLIQVCLAAGWLPEVSTEFGAIRPDSLAHVLRAMRNHIHPGRVCRSRPWVETELRDYEDAEVIYAALFATLAGGSHLKKFREIAASSLIKADGESK